MNKRDTAVLGICCACVFFLSGCSAFRISIREPSPDETKPLDTTYDYGDLRKLADQVAKDLLAEKIVAEAQKKPLFVVMTIQNRTNSHIDTQALGDTVRTIMLKSGKVDFANSARRDDLLKEQGYQLANCTPETRVAIGRVLGADYMLTGSLIEISGASGREVRVSKKEDVYYQLTVEVTNLETGLIAATTQHERLRRASKPLIGW